MLRPERVDISLVIKGLIAAMTALADELLDDAVVPRLVKKVFNKVMIP